MLKFIRKTSPSKAVQHTERKAARSLSARSISLPQSSRFVLFLGDEGAILVHLRGRSVLSRYFVPDASEQNLSEFRQALEKDPRAPILMVIDSMDQSYVQQTLPPVSSLGIGKMIKRRLDRDFAGNDIKGALVLGREKTGRKDWNFMMIAQERSPQLNLWLDFVQELPNRFEGIRLVSVEVESVLRRLDERRGLKKKDPRPEWRFFVSHNKVGGFRQVILRNGRMVFTRLAQPLTDENPEVVAGSIEQEMLSTVEYMKRLSFNPQAGLEIVMVTSQAIKEALDYRKFNTTSIYSYTPYELSQLFGMEGATQPTDQYGDVLLAALIGSSPRHVLRLDVPQFKKINQYYQLMTLQRLTAALMVIGLLGMSVVSAVEIFTASSDIETLTREKETNQRTLQALKDEIKRTNLDVEKATDLIDLYQQLGKQTGDPFEFIERLRPLITPPITLKSIEWQISATRPNISSDTATSASSPQVAPMAASPNQDTRWIIVNLVVELPGLASETKKRMAIINKIIKDFGERLPGYEIEADKKLIEEAREQEKNRKLAADRTTRETEATPATPLSTESRVEEKVTIVGPLIMPAPLASATAPAASAPQPANAGGGT